MAEIQLNEWAAQDPPAELLAGLWNAAMGDEWRVSSHAAAYNLLPYRTVTRAGRLAMLDGQPAGFALAETTPDNDDACLSALAVAPGFQGRGVGSALVAWACSWLAARGASQAYLGGSSRPWAPGLPEGSPAARAFFQHRGFQGEEKIWDMARSLRDYTGPQLSQWPVAEVRPAQSADLPSLFDLLAREFPYWENDYRQFFADGGRPADVMLLFGPQGLTAFCWVTLADSARPLDRFFPYALGQPWAQLGSVGTAEASRGRGYAGVLLDASLRHLQSLGVDGCVIDWTGYLDFYAKFGFAPYHAYWSMTTAVNEA
jgi:GNAT superfamily N-acetyltransferase